MEYYSAIKRNEAELFVVRWMDLEAVIPSEVSQKEICRRISTTWQSNAAVSLWGSLLMFPNNHLPVRCSCSQHASPRHLESTYGGSLHFWSQECSHSGF